MGKASIKTIWTFVIFTVVIISAVFIYYHEQPNFQAIINGNKTVKTPNFSDYPITERFVGEAHKVNYDDNESAKEFKSQIEKKVKEGANFAGHYTVVLWDCGTSCQTGVVVDLINGRVYGLPSKIITCGVEFQIDSSLLIVNYDKDCVNDPNVGQVRTKYYIWKNS